MSHLKTFKTALYFSPLFIVANLLLSGCQKDVEPEPDYSVVYQSVLDQGDGKQLTLRVLKIASGQLIEIADSTGRIALLSVSDDVLAQSVDKNLKLALLNENAAEDEVNDYLVGSKSDDSRYDATPMHFIGLPSDVGTPCVVKVHSENQFKFGGGKLEIDRKKAFEVEAKCLPAHLKMDSTALSFPLVGSHEETFVGGKFDGELIKNGHKVEFENKAPVQLYFDWKGAKAFIVTPSDGWMQLPTVEWAMTFSPERDLTNKQGLLDCTVASQQCAKYVEFFAAQVSVKGVRNKADELFDLTGKVSFAVEVKATSNKILCTRVAQNADLKFDPSDLVQNDGDEGTQAVSTEAKFSTELLNDVEFDW